MIVVIICEVLVLTDRVRMVIIVAVVVVISGTVCAIMVICRTVCMIVRVVVIVVIRNLSMTQRSIRIVVDVVVVVWQFLYILLLVGIRLGWWFFLVIDYNTSIVVQGRIGFFECLVYIVDTWCLKPRIQRLSLNILGQSQAIRLTRECYTTGCEHLQCGS